MNYSQTVEIPANSRIITIEVPHEIPAGPVILTFTIPQTSKKRKVTEDEEIEYINRHADRLNAEALDALSYQVPLWDDEE